MRRFVKSIPGAGRLRGLAVGGPKGPTPTSGTLRPVVYLPTWAQWVVLHQRPQFLLEAFAAAGHPVYFVDPRERTERFADGVTIVPSVAAVPGEHVILYIHFAPLRELVDRFTDAVVVYDILDDLTIYEADEVGLPTERRVAHHHPFLMERADKVIVSNPVLVDRHASERGGLILVENGVDSSRFSEPAVRPDDVPDTGPPIIGYRGAIAQWFDFDLLRTVATSEPEWRFVLVGPIDERVLDDVQSFEHLHNVEFMGERDSNEMPAYAQAFDVEAIWFIVNELTEGVTPLKMFEALASGTPVVSTPIPACVEEPAIRTAANPALFATAVRDALAEAHDPDWIIRAQAIAQDADWTRRIQPLLDRLDDANQRIVA
jgi:glycosyltransferase involved in cell wall biosynthesis